ncbi:hypothetical protein B1R94_16305 [Mycolicibacterium litorale]|nr:hypothetical protein B1R94_16305 [Mycolicibacterium litorale]
MRNAVIAAAASCVMFMIAFVTGSVWASVGVIALAVAGLLLVAGDARAQRRPQGRPGREGRDEEPTESTPALTPDDFAPDISDGRPDGNAGDVDDVTRSGGIADEYRDDPFPFGEPLRVADDPGEGRTRSPSRPGG